MDEPAIDTTPRVSALAVSSLVFGLLCCIPGSGLIGTILGGAGLVRISQSDGRLSGRGMAFSGLILGLLGTMLWLGLGIGTVWAMKEAQRFVQPIQAVTSGDTAAARQRLSKDAAAALTDEKGKAFTEAVQAEVGVAKRMPKGIGEWFSNYMEVGPMIEGAQGASAAGKQAIPFPVHFEREVALVLVYVDEDAPQTGGFPPIKNVSVHTKSGKIIWLLPPGS
jgi:hypothetical protein